jgi:hypothetical protein
MKNKLRTPILYFMMFTMLLFIHGCDKSVNIQNQELDLSQITETGTEGPYDFIGNIDLTDWSPTNYNNIVFGSSYWIRKPSSSDTLYFSGLLSGDSSGQSLKIYNWGNTPLSVKLQLSNPFFATHDSVVIQPSMLGSIDLYFLLPDTTNTVHNGTVTIRFSTQDSIILKLMGTRARHDTGSVVEILPPDFFLAPAYPNPTNGEIRFEYAVPLRVDVVLRVVNKKNEVVATLAQGNRAAGVYIVSWNANVANDNYRVIFQAGNYTSKGDIRVLR